jgi:hypothetical protein
MEICPMCEGNCVIVTVPTEEVVWGMTDSPYGQHKFIIENVRYYECQNPNCKEGFFDHELSQEREQKMNEWFITNIGLDWLGESEKRRVKRKK